MNTVTAPLFAPAPDWTGRDDGPGAEHARWYSEVKAQLIDVREHGWESECEEVSRGQESVAVAVLDHLERPAAALAATFPVGSADKQELLGALTDASARLRTQFFGNR